MSLSWKPVRRGNVFCAPACGRGCTIAEYREAERKAKRLALRLSGVDTDVKSGAWKPIIHENLGWHFHVNKGAVSVYQYSITQYAACLNLNGPWGGNMWARASSPERAVKDLLTSARKELVSMAKLAERLGK